MLIPDSNVLFYGDNITAYVNALAQVTGESAAEIFAAQGTKTVAEYTAFLRSLLPTYGLEVGTTANGAVAVGIPGTYQTVSNVVSGASAAVTNSNISSISNGAFRVLVDNAVDGAGNVVSTVARGSSKGVSGVLATVGTTVPAVASIAACGYMGFKGGYAIGQAYADYTVDKVLESGEKASFFDFLQNAASHAFIVNDANGERIHLMETTALSTLMRLMAAFDMWTIAVSDIYEETNTSPFSDVVTPLTRTWVGFNQTPISIGGDQRYVTPPLLKATMSDGEELTWHIFTDAAQKETNLLLTTCHASDLPPESHRWHTVFGVDRTFNNPGQVWLRANGSVAQYISNTGRLDSYTYDGKTSWTRLINNNVPPTGTGQSVVMVSSVVQPSSLQTLGYEGVLNQKLGWTLMYGDAWESHGGGTDIPGVEPIPGQTPYVPDTSTWTDDASTLASLRQQYPDLFGDTVIINTITPDGTPTTTEYVPIPYPTLTPDGQWEFPPSTPSSYQNPTITPNPNPTPEIQNLYRGEMMPQIPTPNAPYTDTGTGSGPSLTPPVGSPSSLWSVYNPTLQQVNDFGAWLWTEDVIQKIQQLLQNPMEGVISLHKVFCTPATSGTSAITVGRLASTVQAAKVTQQYVTVDCGSVAVREAFGSVLDYSPQTAITCYLPFVGFVALDCDDVMRSTLHIVYQCDVYTGTVLAQIYVTRDGNTSCLYAYPGTSAVTYTLTGSQHTNLASSLGSIIGGVVGTIGGVVSGNPMMALGGATTAAGGFLGATIGAETHQARSGSIGGPAAAMGIKKPYLIIERPQAKVAGDFARLQGYPTNISGDLGNFHGLTVCSAHRLDGIPCTDGEREEIASLLGSGVIV